MNSILEKIIPETWIISDTHFKHKGILKFEPNRLKVMLDNGYLEEEHDKWLIDNWNSKVKHNDKVLLLGDFAFSAVAETIKKLNGNIIVVLGNHDAPPKAQKWKDTKVIDGFYWKEDKYYVRVENEDPMFSGFIKEFEGKKYLFSHYPVFDEDDWDRKNDRIRPRIEMLESIYNYNNCDYNVHGHTHSNTSVFKNSINVCAEHLDFKPIKLGKLLKLKGY